MTILHGSMDTRGSIQDGRSDACKMISDKIHVSAKQTFKSSLKPPVASAHPRLASCGGPRS